jgi:hypothetical protein
MMMTLLLITGLIVLLVFALFDTFWPLTVGLILGLAAGWWFGHSGLLLPLLQPQFAVLYFLIGLGWVFFKWTRLVEKKLKEHYIAYGHNTARVPTPPKWEVHSWNFSAYFFYWPLDMVAYVLSDLLRDAWRVISRTVSRSFDRYAEWRFNKGVL